MSSEPQIQSLEQRAKTKLVKLVHALQPVVDDQLDEFEAAEITHVLDNFKQFLVLDLARDFEKRRDMNIKESPFDAIINDGLK